MEEEYTCVHCDLITEDEDEFVTDIDANVDPDEMTCESCYDDMNVKPEPKFEGVKVYAEIKDATHSWQEYFKCESAETAEEEIKVTIDWFNGHLREGEIKREFVKIIIQHRLFIETDVLQQEELETATFIVSDILDHKGLLYSKGVFDSTVEFAFTEPQKAWEAVKKADEIYGDSALIPLGGIGTNTGAPVVMNVMMYNAIQEGIEGKSVYFLRAYKDIHWDGIKEELVHKAFINNKLFTLETNDDESRFVEVDTENFTNE